MDKMRLLREVAADFKKLSETFEELARRAIEEGVSRYPAFVASPGPIALGVAVAAPGSHAVFKYYFMTTIEELTRKKVIADAAAFKKAFRNPLEIACILCVAEEPQLVFIPYREPEFDFEPV
ncbi:MAG: hypothetical protein NZ534_01715, partial [Bacteroidia bacterium]|nr:hypothetical protein [Bacteroidia bacterium]